ncbi:MAG: exo-alpha-sialidase [Bacteroidales bacterium]
MTKIRFKKNLHLFISLFVFACVFNLVSCSLSEDSGIITVNQHIAPILIEKDFNKVAELIISLDKADKLKAVTIKFANPNIEEILEEAELFIHADKELISIGKTSKNGQSVRIEGEQPIDTSSLILTLSLKANAQANIDATIHIETISVEFEYMKTQRINLSDSKAIRLGRIVRQQGQDSCDTYRIPGLVRTNRRTLIAVYDARYNNSKDLQEDIDIGMSRSTDGGQTWESMKIIMDMGEWGQKAQRLNGVGDPSILYDKQTNTLWVAALWMSGATEKEMLWWASKPGLKPDITGQFLIVKSTDDGQTWSKPINITEQIKDPNWQLLLAGPGCGISMKDGTLVFPAQFKVYIGEKSLDGGQYTCHSTIVYSKDHGETWHIGSGAKSNTTEAQVVELPNGSLMLNMRDDRNRKDKGNDNGRAVAITKDMGKTWTVHPSSNHALPESNCMASLISADIKIGEEVQSVLFFSNPNNKEQRTNMTIKASIDEGQTWLEAYQLELNEDSGFGYSCMTQIDEEIIGILYEGVKELYFQRIPIADVLRTSKQ